MVEDVDLLCVSSQGYWNNVVEVPKVAVVMVHAVKKTTFEMGGKIQPRATDNLLGSSGLPEAFSL